MFRSGRSIAALHTAAEWDVQTVTPTALSGGRGGGGARAPPAAQPPERRHQGAGQALVVNIVAIGDSHSKRTARAMAPPSHLNTLGANPAWEYMFLGRGVGGAEHEDAEVILSSLFRRQFAGPARPRWMAPWCPWEGIS